MTNFRSSALEGLLRSLPNDTGIKTTAEVLGGLIKAFRDYEQNTEAAWRR